MTFSEAISGIGSLTQAGDGTLILRASNDYDGGTMVNSGTLSVTNPNALPNGMSLTVGAGRGVALRVRVRRPDGSECNIRRRIGCGRRPRRGAGTGHAAAAGCRSPCRGIRRLAKGPFETVHSIE